MNNRVKILQNKEKPVSTKILADSIVTISDGIKEIRSQGLNDRAIEVLLVDSTGVTITEIRKVIAGLSALATNYVRK
jgi:hypothetical protein